MPWIFKNPIGWAKTVAGTKLRYRYMQIATIVLGLVIFVFIIILLPQLHFLHCIGIGIAIFLSVVELPLCYLKAIRHFIVNMEESGGKEKSQT